MTFGERVTWSIWTLLDPARAEAMLAAIEARDARGWEAAERWRVRRMNEAVRAMDYRQRQAPPERGKRVGRFVRAPEWTLAARRAHWEAMTRDLAQEAAEGEQRRAKLGKEMPENYLAGTTGGLRWMSRAEVETQRAERDRAAMEAEAARGWNPLGARESKIMAEHADRVSRAFNGYRR